MRHRGSSLIFIGLCAVLIAAPLLWLPFGADGAENAENRRLREPPDLLELVRRTGSVHRGSLEYTNALSAFIDDNFTFRKELVTLHHWIKSAVFQVDPIPGKTVQGERGWYFLGDEYGSTLKESIGLIVFTDDEVNAIDRNLDESAAWCDSAGVIYRMAIVRNKDSAFPDLLGLPRRPVPTKYERIRALSAGDNEVVDLNTGFNAFRRQGLRTYCRTDSHWNKAGAFIGYMTLMRSLARSTSTLDTLGWSDVRLDTITGEPGDQSKLLGLTTPEQEVDAVILHPINGAPVAAEFPAQPGRYPKGYERRYHNPKRSGKVLFFHDSFGFPMAKYLAESFGEVLMIRNIHFDRDLIAKERPDIVITQLVERNLDDLLTIY